MISINQAVGLLIAISLSVMFLMIGYQILVILQELRKTVDKVNRSLDDTNRVTEAVSDPIITLAGFLNGIQQSSRLFQVMMGIGSNHQNSMPTESDNGHQHAD